MLPRRYLALSLFVALLGTARTSAQTTATRMAHQFGWHANLEGAKTAARQTGKPIFLVFRCDP